MLERLVNSSCNYFFVLENIKNICLPVSRFFFVCVFWFCVLRFVIVCFCACACVCFVSRFSRVHVFRAHVFLPSLCVHMKCPTPPPPTPRPGPMPDPQRPTVRPPPWPVSGLTAHGLGPAATAPGGPARGASGEQDCNGVCIGRGPRPVGRGEPQTHSPPCVPVAHFFRGSMLPPAQTHPKALIRTLRVFDPRLYLGLPCTCLVG